MSKERSRLPPSFSTTVGTQAMMAKPSSRPGTAAGRRSSGMVSSMARLAGVQLTPELESYIESLLPERDAVLRRLEEEIEESNIPGVGPAVGQLLALLVRIGGVRDVIELGTAIGYSAIWLGRACAGELVTLELEPDRARRARRALDEAGPGGPARVGGEEGGGYPEREPPPG